MSKTFRHDAVADKDIRDGETYKKYYRKEAGFARKQTRRKVRHKTKATLQTVDAEAWDETNKDLPDYCGTSGWLTH